MAVPKPLLTEFGIHYRLRVVLQIVSKLKKGNNLLFSRLGEEVTNCVKDEYGDGWCAVSVDNDNFMKTWGQCQPGCVFGNGKLVPNMYDDYYGDDYSYNLLIPDYDVEW